jgi:heme-degrading monooxygenase HmoA
MSVPLKTVATIEAGREIFTLINTFHVRPSDQGPLVAELAAVTEGSMRHLSGFIGSSVHRSVDGNYVVNYVQWETREDFTAMFENAEAKAHMEKVKALSLSVTPVFYVVAYVGARGA